MTVFLMVGCEQKAPYRKTTFPVKGSITVDGNVPDSPVKIECVPISQVDDDPSHFSMSFTMSKTDGSFNISTYQSDDGIPAGEYALTFMWGKLNLMSGQYGGPDKLNGRYSDPKKSEIKVTVADEPIDLGMIELTTK